jgi:hypothetical protein
MLCSCFPPLQRLYFSTQPDAKLQIGWAFPYWVVCLIPIRLLPQPGIITPRRENTRRAVCPLRHEQKPGRATRDYFVSNLSIAAPFEAWIKTS